ncbi:hypothetical protein [Azospirillum doebereinerae]|uniref:Uncharacterized protein n=1 Tax=Azospirillum doebereinerae TaxID=92933 RepID=A0A433J1A1_9PROT|nr:hypothetical protein [Azospirillum doebereinerae]RUQ63982.1 hypothetical protein EJ913_27040 [Azospirillum doebereinerae]
MFRYATGWLGWTRDVALDAPFPDIKMALDGKVDFLAATTPGGKRKERKPGKAALNTKLKAMLGLGKPKGAG